METNTIIGGVETPVKSPVKHWRVELDDTGRKAMSIRCDPDDNDSGTTICDMFSSRGIEETKRNAYLMAAAPRMYDALKELFEQCAMVHKYWGEDSNTQQANDAIANARAAIAKAEEQS
jgi:hypothetical protein